MMRSNKFPTINEITMVIPFDITDIGVYVRLLEYGCLEGLITIRNLSNKRIKSIKQIVQIGKKFAASVQSVDEKTNNIMLSKIDVSAEENTICINNYKKLKTINNLATLFVNRMEHKYGTIISIEDIYRDFIWNLSVNANEVLSLLELAAIDFHRIYGNQLDMYHLDMINCWAQILKSKYQIKEVTIEIIVEITCFSGNGIKDIQRILLNAKNNMNNFCPLNIKLLKVPQYSISTIVNDDQAKIMSSWDHMIENIEAEIKQCNGTFKIIKSNGWINNN